MIIHIKKLTGLLLRLIGALILVVFIWYRFIRPRLPKEIPFKLSEYGCMILIYICCIYLFIIVSLVITSPVNKHISVILDHIYKPLRVLDESIKAQSKIDYYHKAVIVYFTNILNEKNYIYIYGFFNIFPRIVLVTALGLDTFWFNRLEYLYKVILIGLLLLLYKYIIYCLKYAKEQYIIDIETIVKDVKTNYNEDPADTTSNFVAPRDFITIQANTIFYNNPQYICNPLTYYKYAEQFPWEIRTEERRKEPLRLINIVVSIAVHIEKFNFIHNYNKKINYIKIIIFSIYFICWFTILIVSLPRLPPEAFEWLWIIQDIENPFSILLHKYETYR